MNDPLFDLFWENSKLSRRNIADFLKRIETDNRDWHDLPRMVYPSLDLRLARPGDGLARVMDKRKSGRKFSERAVTEKQMGSLFFAFSQKSDGTRLVPSGGGKYPVEAYAFLFNVEGKLNQKTVYYNADSHSLSVLGPCPEWEGIREATGLWIEGRPAILFVFAAFPERSMEKYGGRGARFALFEVGHYCQNLALRLAQEDLAGVEAGGLYDEEIKKYLKLENTGAIITLGFACGNRG